MALEKQARQDARVEASPSLPSIDSVAEDNARAGLVFISGATGPRAEVINGFYEATEEKGLDGRVVYMKRGDGSVCIEHFGALWRVKFVSWKGTNISLADVIGLCAFEACASRVWRVWVGGKVFQDQPSVKMLTGAEAELQVSGCCKVAREHNAACNARIVSFVTRCAFFRRALHMPPLLRALLLWTTRELGSCSSAARQAPWLMLSTGFTKRRRRRDWMGVWCT